MAAAGGGAAAAHGARPVYASVNATFGDVRGQINALWGILVHRVERLGISPSTNTVPYDENGELTFGTWIISYCLNSSHSDDPHNIRTLTYKVGTANPAVQETKTLRYRLYFTYNYGGVFLVREEDWREFGRMPSPEDLPFISGDSSLFDDSRAEGELSLQQGGMNFLYMLRHSADRLRSERREFELKKERWRLSHQDPLPNTNALAELAMLHAVTAADFSSDRAQETLALYAAPHLTELPERLLRATAERTQAEHVAAAERHTLETRIAALRNRVQVLEEDARDLLQERSELELAQQGLICDRAADFLIIQRGYWEIDELRAQLGEQSPPRAQDASFYAAEHDRLDRWMRGLPRAPPDFGPPADAAGAADLGGPASPEGTLRFGAGAPPPKRGRLEGSP
jgi:hypothetical protein